MPARMCNIYIHRVPTVTINIWILDFSVLFARRVASAHYAHTSHRLSGTTFGQDDIVAGDFDALIFA